MTQGIEQFSDDDFSLIRAHGSVVNYKSGDVIIEQGMKLDRLFWVVSGRVHIGLSRIAHRDPIDDLGAGKIFGEIPFLLDSESPTFAVAVDESEVLEIGTDEFRELKVAYPGMAARFFKSLSQSLAGKLKVLTEV